jgi:hypothetical protein
MLFIVNEMWQMFPPSWNTVGNRSLAFRCLSRMACAQWQMLGSDHLRFPLQMFRLLGSEDSSLAEHLLRTPDCLLDQWSKGLRADYPTLSGAEFDVVLAATAVGYMVDISEIESKHAAIRRTLLAASLQTHQMSAHNLSARWCLQQYRRQAHTLHPSASAPNKLHGKMRARRSPTLPEDIGRARKHPTGGTQRAFFRMASLWQKGKPNFTELHDLFAQHRDQMSTMYRRAVALGKVATRCAGATRTSQSAFGPNAKDMRRRMLERLSIAVLNRVGNMDVESHIVEIADQAVLNKLTMSQTLGLARKAHKHTRMAGEKGWLSDTRRSVNGKRHMVMSSPRLS